jgi:tRNA(fMet)-specific endonuclease VapC
MRIALDTNRYVDFARRETSALETVRLARELFMPLIVLAELRAGFVAGTRSSENESNLIRFLNSPRVRVLYPDENTSHHYARLYLQLRQQGTPLPTNDLWIASLVVQHELILCSRDTDFDHFAQIPRI